VIAGLQANITIGNLQAEVKSRQAQLLRAQTPSTVTKLSAQETEAHADQMASIESNMERMTTQYTKWMGDMQQITIKPCQTPEHGTKHSQNKCIDQLLSSQQSKRADTQNTPEQIQNLQTRSMDNNQGSQLFQDLDDSFR
jgi:hypothetical protein